MKPRIIIGVVLCLSLLAVLGAGLSQAQGLEEMREVGEKLGLQYLRDNMQDLQNCLCEFDKYVRVYNGEGTPRSRYDGYGPGKG